ncbi:protein-glutamate methylesterase/protein-glutamine glutaminase [Tindallia californiensis]|uniref:Protein-glutamate methylesterase/protein-glutamine glutaminase n=1 Tax=Tindallia californiensis TaxID=159292 RepID=A0A1H3KEW7_9FIRM|nr:chemotaxis response regulator protein-glutamate methylesterase [Tindallia californiensis]SDY50636.1 two-component system, chemotaxis family, response regulator CheB [Tindallia californiensis]
MQKTKPIRVLIVDDSMISREVIKKGLTADPGIMVVGTAADPYEAVEMIEKTSPDVLTLDVNMPRMDGITFLKKLMQQHPMPVVVISGSEHSVLKALETGAVDFVKKPDIKTPEDLKAFLEEIVYVIKVATVSKTKPLCKTPVAVEKVIKSPNKKEIELIAMGASTGGTDALMRILKEFPTTAPGVVIVQHMPPTFTRMYAERLDSLCEIEVMEAKTGVSILPGRALIAPGGLQMKVLKNGSGYKVKCYSGEKVSGHCPSVDVLFESVADTVGKKAMGVILTGMGSDGAKGLLNMKKAGAYTIGQDQKSSVVYGMPMVAYNIGAVEKQLPLEEIARHIFRSL